MLAALCFVCITLLFVGIGHDWWGWLARLQMLPAVTRLIGSATLGNIAVVLGILLIPTFLKKFKKHLNDETLTIFSIGLCLGMVLLAVQSGFSSALGAFVMGSVLAETIDAERIEHLVQPVKNIFGSIFFVSSCQLPMYSFWTSLPHL